MLFDTSTKVELFDGMIFRIQEESFPSTKITAIYLNEDYSNDIPRRLLIKAVKTNKYIIYKNKNFEFVDMELPEIITMDFLKTCHLYKPEDLIISDLKWRYGVRNVLKSKNLVLLGHTGCGKTLFCTSLARVLKRPFFKFPMNAMQDPRSSLIGNTFFDTNSGTFFSESLFIKAIKTPNAIILLDELSRAHPDALNILMTVLDEDQRYLRIDESTDQDTVNVADGVSFIATANIGNEYTGTRVVDRAITDRFKTIEMELLTETQLFNLLKYKYPDVGDGNINILSKLYNSIKIMFNNEELSTMLSTRMSVEVCDLLNDGFNLLEALEITLLPLFSPDGGAASERVKVKNIMDSLIPTDDDVPLFPIDGVSPDNPFFKANN